LKTEKLQLRLEDTSEVAENGSTRAISAAAVETARSPVGDAPPSVAPKPESSPRAFAVAPARAGVNQRFLAWKALAAVFATVCVIVGVASYVRYRAHRRESDSGSDAAFPLPASVPGNTVRAMVGDGRAPYVDRASQTWSSDTFCTGGTSFSVPARPILATFDTQLFLSGRAGLFHCAFPVPPGTYEVHLLFAETTSVEETGRTVDFSLNGEPTKSMDVVDDAGGNDTATEKVFTDIQPEQDGKIHVDFTSTPSYVNAIEILPSVPSRMLPVRIYAGETPYRDSEGNVWLPNRYYFGGRESHYQVVDAAGIPDGELYKSQWIGHFRYVIPVAAGEKYTVKLYFRESYFGGQDGGGGVVGSRVFDVWCDGSVILKHFDILREAGSAPLIKTFEHIEPTGQDKIEIYFVPVVNYPSLNAIEVIPE
jgi:hypothetical protein